MNPPMLPEPAGTDERSWYTTGEVAALLGVTARSVANWANAGLLAHHVTAGGHRRFLAKDVHVFIGERMRSTAGQAPHPDGPSSADGPPVKDSPPRRGRASER
jgi:excisionase family DNA binding protein